MKMTPNHFFWNILGTIALGFGMLVLTSSLTPPFEGVAHNLMRTNYVWGVLTEPFITPYGFFLIVASGAACFVIIRYVTARGIIGFRQVIIVAAVVLALRWGIELVGSTSTGMCWPTCSVLTSHVWTFII